MADESKTHLLLTDPFVQVPAQHGATFGRHTTRGLEHPGEYYGTHKWGGGQWTSDAWGSVGRGLPNGPFSSGPWDEPQWAGLARVAPHVGLWLPAPPPPLVHSHHARVVWTPDPRLDSTWAKVGYRKSSQVLPSKWSTIPGATNPPPGVPHLPHAGPRHPSYGWPTSETAAPGDSLVNSLERPREAVRMATTRPLPESGYRVDAASSQAFRAGGAQTAGEASPPYLRA